MRISSKSVSVPIHRMVATRNATGMLQPDPCGRLFQSARSACSAHASASWRKLSSDATVSNSATPLACTRTPIPAEGGSRPIVKPIAWAVCTSWLTTSLSLTYAGRDEASIGISNSPARARASYEASRPRNADRTASNCSSPTSSSALTRDSCLSSATGTSLSRLYASLWSIAAQACCRTVLTCISARTPPYALHSGKSSRVCAARNHIMIRRVPKPVDVGPRFTRP
jgi:hypothetical protein